MSPCVLHYGWFVLASLIGSGIGTSLVLRFWKTGEMTWEPDKPDGGAKNGNETRR